MTLVYSLGIFTVMLPVVLGAKVIADWAFKFHDQTYLAGGLFMIFSAGLAFLGIKLPMPRISRYQPSRPDIISTYTLGLFAGVTSSCCAPVLLGVLTLSALTPGLAASLLVGTAYVLGMVTPLYLASLVIDQKKLLDRPIMKRQITTLLLAGKTYPIFVANLIAGITFAATGMIILYLTLTGRLGMPEPAKINWQLNALTQNSFFNLFFAIIGVMLLYQFIKRAGR